VTERTPRMWTSVIEDPELATLDVCLRAIDARPLPERRRIVEYLVRRVDQDESIVRVNAIRAKEAADAE